MQWTPFVFMYRKEKSVRSKLFKSFKIAIAALLAIVIAGELSLEYSATAGIITVLSIGNTKRETLLSAKNRGLAFVCALVLAALSFGMLGYNLVAFAVYLFLFAMLCFVADWREAIAMDSVLISHFLAQQSMGIHVLLNEIGLFLIGTILGILMNLHLRKKEEEFDRLAEEVDRQMKEVLHHMKHELKDDRDKSQKDCRENCLEELAQRIEQAKFCAVNNYNNAFFGADMGELDYIRMREQQSVVLQGIYENIKSINYLPEQAKRVANLLGEIEQGYHKNNTVEGLIQKLEQLLRAMKKENLPATREEFEARAILFYILMQLEKLLFIKRDYWREQGIKEKHKDYVKIE